MTRFTASQSSCPFLAPSAVGARHGRWSRAVALLSVLLMGAPVFGASGAELLGDDFENGGRAGWFNLSGGGNALLVSKNPAEHALTGNALQAINSGATGVVYFAARALDVGQSLTINFKLSLASVGDADGNLRFVVLDSSGGSKVRADGNNLDQFAGYQGYRVFTNAGSDVNGRTSLSKRAPGVTSGLTTGSGWVSLGGSSATGVALAAKTAYPASITYERTGRSSLKITFTLNGVTSQVVDNAATSFAFDTFGYSKTASNGTLYLDDVLVSLR